MTCLSLDHYFPHPSLPLLLPWVVAVSHLIIMVLISPFPVLSYFLSFFPELCLTSFYIPPVAVSHLTIMVLISPGESLPSLYFPSPSPSSLGCARPRSCGCPPHLFISNYGYYLSLQSCNCSSKALLMIIGMDSI